jgi:hypothetical protein
MLWLVDVASVPGSQSVVTVRRSGLCGWAGYGCIWHNRLIGAPEERSLIAYDH